MDGGTEVPSGPLTGEGLSREEIGTSGGEGRGVVCPVLLQSSNLSRFAGGRKSPSYEGELSVEIRTVLKYPLGAVSRGSLLHYGQTARIQTGGNSLGIQGSLLRLLTTEASGGIGG